MNIKHSPVLFRSFWYVLECEIHFMLVLYQSLALLFKIISPHEVVVNNITSCHTVVRLTINFPISLPLPLVSDHIPLLMCRLCV